MAAPDFQHPVDELQRILRPWLGDVFCPSPPDCPDDFFCLIREIKGCGFTRLTLQNRYANPDWILPRWRTYAETECPRCHQKIAALLKSHKIGRHSFVPAPAIFCNCVRLEPSRLPSLSFFTDHWHIVLEALDFMVAYAKQRQDEPPRALLAARSFHEW